uniref:Uncharacterized protein n=1 Tax=Aegilops tauschii subsp. strangulata TaxID=200361 RepID=A0A452YMZ3_AEGTS
PPESFIFQIVFFAPCGDRHLSLHSFPSTFILVAMSEPSFKKFELLQNLALYKLSLLLCSTQA